ncbi:hypothetical protein U2F26_03180 [Micromonospora sp. 4G57]|uniref:Uncharacterized protein n=1 Tax=Micromonospora sicca TaxID=2202420 RepID=A0ABU5JCK5_9ACTN|nr:MULTISPECIES: hypothetical protein [unclassified Micromonospora]MDZ5441734.1 hypothetical protein [Micromonospora sp. 4G57]MDZ5490295.1 hypothetical protein [Micromonospora sp. 4G53]
MPEIALRVGPDPDSGLPLTRPESTGFPHRRDVVVDADAIA